MTIPYRVNRILPDKKFGASMGILFLRVRVVDPRGAVLNLTMLPRPGLRVGSILNLEPPRVCSMWNGDKPVDARKDKPVENL